MKCPCVALQFLIHFLITPRVWGDNRYGFYRAVEASGARSSAESRQRLVDGQVAPRDAWPAACLLADHNKAALCSGSVVADHWALTAAHCVSSNLAYVKYNMDSAAAESQVQRMYRHPAFRVELEKVDQGEDVMLLQNDIGLVRTTNPMQLTTTPVVNPIQAMTMYTMHDIVGDEVQVVGFASTSEQLMEGRLKVKVCDRGTWLYCACGTAEGGVGVCAADSGGAVLYRGAQLAVVSLGPIECCEGAGGGEDSKRPNETATSVFTMLNEYASLINATVNDNPEETRMSVVAARVASNPGRRPGRGPRAGAAALALYAPLIAVAVALAL